MASLSVNGLDEYAFGIEELASIPDSVIEEMLRAEGVEAVGGRVDLKKYGM